MAAPAPAVVETEAAGAYALTPHQVTFFETFGFLRLPGYFAEELAEVTEAFESVFGAKAFLQYMAARTGAELTPAQPTGAIESDPAWFETNFELHYGRDRVTVPDITARDERLAAFERSPKLRGVIASLLGPDFETKPADGNLFSCDTSWHADTYGSPLTEYHVKLSLYLDPLGADSGTIRFLPGTNFYQSDYANRLLRMLWSPATIEEHFGIDARDVPGFAVESEPGDAVLWSYRTIHASFGGGERRRLLSFNFREPQDGPSATA